jgi:uncharacterized phage-associated protein
MLRAQGGVRVLERAPYDAETIAKWFIAFSEQEEYGDGAISNMKLQKLLYYAQGQHLAACGQVLFNDPIEAWDHGPVIPSLYHRFKGTDDGLTLDPDDPFEWSDVDPEVTQLLLDVWDTYGGIAAWKLRAMTHNEAPWAEAYRAGVSHIRIDQSAMERYFKAHLA